MVFVNTQTPRKVAHFFKKQSEESGSPRDP